ncbi:MULTISPECIES: hypothetical protein [unclassified Exiguobacterium]|nr:MULTISPECIES: hypothetical protein [unclassified Exiguobacterium]
MDERLLNDYAFDGLDPFVRTVFSELMARPDQERISIWDMGGGR